MDDRRCPCGTGETLAACCGRYLLGLGDAKPAPTAEALMRSRYTAFALGDEAHLLATWHPDTRPESCAPDRGTRWLHLTIDDVVGGSPFHTDGVVEFTAVYRDEAGRGELHERSRFVKADGSWLYVDGVVRTGRGR
ncbi:YchJ family protein [Gordonia hydrophobica]|uniref:YchJ family metal-binding protein n=1 Tax=Gordonia hydrophobica TaxID=40516 RepID=A0ABZ2U356_9ACTN|nr:YchJ family metal-binding protein [Gordonia hydrophobica]MBM7367421.1 SEC-C motif-containing protein [Gordonia hydrophobica]